MGQSDTGLGLQVGFHIFPVPLVVPDPPAVSAHRQQIAQCLNLGDSLPEFDDQPRLLSPGLLHLAKGARILYRQRNHAGDG